MASKLNSEFNYRSQVIGETPWEKIKTLKGFLEGRIRAAALEKCASLKYEALNAELDYAIGMGEPPHITLRLQAEIVEQESHLETQRECFELNREEILILKKLLEELYTIAEVTRIEGYTDDQMFEQNAALEFTMMIGRDIQSEIMANGRPSPSKIRNAMSNPLTFGILQQAGMIPMGTAVLSVLMVEDAKTAMIEAAKTAMIEAAKTAMIEAAKNSVSPALIT